MNFDKIGGRKFVLAIISLIAGLVTHVLSAKGLTSEVVGLIVGVIGTFSVANTVSTIKAPTQEAAVEDDGEVIADNSAELMKSHEALLEQIALTVGQTQQMLLNAMQAGNSKNNG